MAFLEKSDFDYFVCSCTALEFATVAAAEKVLYTALEFATAAEKFLYTALDQSTARYTSFSNAIM